MKENYMKKFFTNLVSFIFLITVTAGMTDCKISVLSVPHVHTPSEEWTYNETYHWHEATCDDTNKKFSVEEHSFGE